MAFPFIKNGMANPLDILVLRKERQNELFENGSGEPSPPPDPHNKNLEIEK